MKRILLVFTFIAFSINYANSQIAFVWAKDENGSGISYMVDCSKETSGRCMSYLYDKMESQGYSNTSSIYGDHNEYADKSGTYVVISSTWENYQGKTIKGYGFGVGSSCTSATQKAIEELKRYTMWKSSYGYQQLECKSYTNTFQGNSQQKSTSSNNQSSSSNNSYYQNNNNQTQTTKRNPYQATDYRNQSSSSSNRTYSNNSYNYNNNQSSSSSSSSSNNTDYYDLYQQQARQYEQNAEKINQSIDDLGNAIKQTFNNNNDPYYEKWEHEMEQERIREEEEREYEAKIGRIIDMQEGFLMKYNNVNTGYLNLNKPAVYFYYYYASTTRCGYLDQHSAYPHLDIYQNERRNYKYWGPMGGSLTFSNVFSVPRKSDGSWFTIREIMSQLGEHAQLQGFFNSKAEAINHMNRFINESDSYYFTDIKTNYSSFTFNPDMDAYYWEQVKKLNSAAEYDKFIKNYPNNRFVGEAEIAIKNIMEEDFIRAVFMNSPAAYNEFLEKWADSKFISGYDENIDKVFDALNSLASSGLIDENEAEKLYSSKVQELKEEPKGLGSYFEKSKISSIVYEKLNEANQNSLLRDNRDGKVYRTTQIGNQLWMADNLNYKSLGSQCIDCKVKGRSYKGKALEARICPAGWHIPSYDEWMQMFEYIISVDKEFEESDYNARSKNRETDVVNEWNISKQLKSKYGWGAFRNRQLDGIDTYGFSAIPIGRDFRSVPFAQWWTSSFFETNDRFGVELMDEGIYFASIKKDTRLFVRCIKNLEEDDNSYKNICDYKKALKAEPDNADYYYSIGVLYFNKSLNYANGDETDDYIRKLLIRKAQSWFVKAININPGNDKYISGLADSYFLAMEYKQAIEKYLLAIKYNSKIPDYYFRLGTSNFFIAKFPEAIEAYKKVNNMNPSYPKASYYLALAYYLNGDFINASEECHKAITLNVKNVECNYLLGKILHLKMNKTNEAKTYFTKVIESDENMNVLKAFAKYYLGEKTEAFDDLQNELSKSKDFSSIHYNLACLYSAENNKKLALTNLEEAFKSGFKFTLLNLKDDDLEGIRYTFDFVNLVGKYCKNPAINKELDKLYAEIQSNGEKYYEKISIDDSGNEIASNKENPAINKQPKETIPKNEAPKEEINSSENKQQPTVSEITQEKIPENESIIDTLEVGQMDSLTVDE